MPGDNYEKKPSPIDKLPLQTRKTILIVTLIILTLVIFSFWLISLQKVLTPSPQSKQQTEELEKIQKDLTGFLAGTKQQFAILKQNLEGITQPQEEPANNLELTPADIAKIKDQLLAGEMKNWSSYQNPEYQYQIKYPPDWSINSQNQKEVFLAKTTAALTIGPLTIKVMAEKNSSALQDFAASFPAGCAQSQETVINANPASQLRCLKTINNVNWEVENYLFEKNNNLYILSFTKTEKSANDILTKIITTFEFTLLPKD